MRKITQNSINAFLLGQEFDQSNTKVTVYNSVSKLYLFGNLIAIKNLKTGIISITNAGWTSNTTKERLNAIPNVNIIQKDYLWYLNGKFWDGKLIEVNS